MFDILLEIKGMELFGYNSGLQVILHSIFSVMYHIINNYKVPINIHKQFNVSHLINHSLMPLYGIYSD